MRIAIVWLAAVAVLAGRTEGAAQPPLFQSTLPLEEFAARRAKVFDAIGDGVAVLEGAAEYPAYVRFRQNNQFFYLTGVEVPRALVLLDGRTRRTALFLQPSNPRLEQSEGPVLAPGPDAARLTGIDAVRPRDEFGAALTAAVAGGRTLYVPFRAESLGASTPQAAAAHDAATAADPWDGRPSRATQFVEKLKAAVPGSAVQDLDPILDRLRLIKSPREVALIREATRLAGEGIMAGIRAARPGMHEYEIEARADAVFKRGGAFGIAYFALVADGVSASWPHYHAGTGLLKDGDLVLFDYAPDFNYYTSDVTRMFPANGHFTPAQRELYTVYLRLYQALMQSIRPHAAPRDIIHDAVAKMDQVLAESHFTDEKRRQAAQAFVDRYRRSTANSLGHMVGMDVHDVNPPYETLEPGMVFTIEPALTIPEDRVYIRLEDVLVITKQGHENLSAFVPVSPRELEGLMNTKDTKDTKDTKETKKGTKGVTEPTAQ